MQYKIVQEIQLSHQRNNGRVNYVAVEKAVVRSQPPRVQDVPEHLKYIQKWGGGTDGKFVKSTNKYIALTCASDRCLTASFFAWLAKLDINISGGGDDDTTNHFVLFVHGMVKAHARGPETDGDNVARHLTQGDCQSATQKNKDKVKEVTLYMKRALALLTEHQNTLSDRDTTLLFGDVQVKLVDLALSKSNVSDAFKSFDKINMDFARRVAAALGQTVPDVQQTHDVPATTVVPNIVEYGDDGEICGAERTSLLTKGFEVGKIVIIQNKEVANHIHYKIIKISNNGIVTVSVIDPKTGEPTLNNKGEVNSRVVPFAEFSDKYVISKKTIKLNEAWPSCNIENNVEFFNMSLKGLMVSALHSIGVDCHKASLRVQSEPSRAVFAKTRFDANTIMLTPSTMQVSIETNPAKKLNSKSFICMCKDQDVRFVLTPLLSKDIIIPFWHMRITNDIASANMRLEERDVDAQAPKLVQTKAKIKRRVFRVPIAVNSETIMDGDELVLFREEEEKVEKEKKRTLVLTDDVGAAKKGRCV